MYSCSLPSLATKGQYKHRQRQPRHKITKLQQRRLLHYLLLSEIITVNSHMHVIKYKSSSLILIRKQLSTKDVPRNIRKIPVFSFTLGIVTDRCIVNAFNIIIKYFFMSEKRYSLMSRDHKEQI